MPTLDSARHRHWWLLGFIAVIALALIAWTIAGSNRRTNTTTTGSGSSMIEEQISDTRQSMNR